MKKSSSINSRSSRTILALTAAALLLVVIVGRGEAAPETVSNSNCASTCINARESFGPTDPVSISEESADRFVSMIEGASANTGRITMNFISVDEGAAVEVLSSNGRTARVRLSAGQVGYVPAAWVSGA